MTTIYCLKIGDAATLIAVVCGRPLEPSGGACVRVSVWRWSWRRPGCVCADSAERVDYSRDMLHVLEHGLTTLVHLQRFCQVKKTARGHTRLTLQQAQTQRVRRAKDLDALKKISKISMLIDERRHRQHSPTFDERLTYDILYYTHTHNATVV